MRNPAALLGPDDPPSYEVARASGQSPFVINCDHAGRILPRSLGSLGLSEHELTRHIAWDIGIAGLGRKLAQRIDAFLILQNYSRLVIDANRPPGTPQSIVTRSEATDIPGNVGLGPLERDARANAIFWPYHQRLTAELDARDQRGRPSLLIALHSFTPIYMSSQRKWQAGVLYGRDTRVGHALLSHLRENPALVVGDNEPYAVSDDTDFSLTTHGEARGIPHVELEIRQDLLADEAGQEAWAERLADAFLRVGSELFPSWFV